MTRRTQYPLLQNPAQPLTPKTPSRSEVVLPALKHAEERGKRALLLRASVSASDIPECQTFPFCTERAKTWTMPAPLSASQYPP